MPWNDKSRSWVFRNKERDFFSIGSKSVLYTTLDDSTLSINLSFQHLHLNRVTLLPFQPRTHHYQLPSYLSKMRLSNLTYFTLTTLSLASPLQPRQTPESSIESLLTSLFATVQTYTGAISTFPPFPLSPSSKTKKKTEN